MFINKALSIFKIKDNIRFLIFLCVIQFWSYASSQSLSVESFRLLETDLTANTQGTIERDQNGDVAALIKIVTSETGFAFDGGMMGIVKTIQKTGEIWVYVPHSIQKITKSQQQLGVLRDYFFPLPIEKARTYELLLKAGTVRTIVEQTVTSQYVVFKVQPKNAIVFVDDEEPRILDSDGMLSIRLKQGHHTYRVTAASYLSESGIIEVQSEKITKEIALQSTKATLTVNTLSDAEIWINDVLRGVGNWTGELEAGEYLIESRKQSHISAKQEITLKQQERRAITISDPIPIYGTLDIQSAPLESDVYVDGKLIGQTPLIVDRFLVGEYDIRIEKKGYNAVEQKIIIDEGSQLSHKYTLLLEEEVFDKNPIDDIESLSTLSNKVETRPQIEPQYVDLGLSVNWASFNLGASKPEEYGNYYAWGETGKKSVYIWQTYKWCEGNDYTLTKYCSHQMNGKGGYVDYKKELDKEDDAAYVIWGEKWRIPTADEWNELLKKCDWEFSKVNGIPGFKVIAKKPRYKGNSIFLPFAGVREGNKVNNTGQLGIYRSSTLDASNSCMAKDFIISQGVRLHIGYDYRFGGLTIRPVCQ